MARGYKIGKRKVTQEVFDAEILRLIGLGLRENQIATQLKTSRWTIGRSLKRSVKNKPTETTEAKQEGSYQKLTNDSFRGLPEISGWIDNFKARGVKFASPVNALRMVCDELQIFPSMLDSHYAQKWLARQAGIKTKSQMRHKKVAIRGWLKYSRNMSDNELQVLGLDAKHYEVGKYATVGLSEQQISKAIFLLERHHKDRKVLLAFRLGTECCCPKQELERLNKSDYLPQEKILRTFREKTGSFWSKYPDQKTAALLMKNDTEKIFTNGDIKYMITRLKQIYNEVEAASPYFNMKPLHALRHTGAQRLLRKTDWNRAVVAVLGGWNAEKTLEDHYGAVPNNIIHNMGQKLWA